MKLKNPMKDIKTNVICVKIITFKTSRIKDMVTKLVEALLSFC